MKIVIELPDDDAKFLMHSSFIPVGCFEKVHKALLNGTPLPKGHGKLIDADALCANSVFPGHHFAQVFHEILKSAPGIVLPDKEVEENEKH